MILKSQLDPGLQLSFVGTIALLVTEAVWGGLQGKRPGFQISDMDSLVRRVSLRALDSDTAVLGRLVRCGFSLTALRKCSSDTSHDFRDLARLSLSAPRMRVSDPAPSETPSGRRQPL